MGKKHSNKSAVILTVLFLLLILFCILFLSEGSSLANASVILKWMGGSTGIFLLALLALLAIAGEWTVFPVTGWTAFGAVTVGAAIAHAVGNAVRNARIAAFQARVSGGELIQGMEQFEAERYQAYKSSDMIIGWWILICVCIVIGITADLLIRKKNK